MKLHSLKRLLSLLLVFAMLAGYMLLPAGAAAPNGKVTFTKVDNSSVSASLLTAAPEAEEEAPAYAATDVVRVSIMLKDRSTIEAGFSPDAIAANSAAMAYRAKLQDQQATVTAAIEKATGKDLDVVWNLTLAANIISANVPYGQIETIEKIQGVTGVVIETQYDPDVVEKDETADPNMATSSKQIGSAAAWAAGYTGAGSRVAIIDTGVDTDHQSFDAAAFQYSLAYWAGVSGKSVDEYLADLDLLDAEEIASVAEELNVSIDPAKVYVNSKIAFGYNYVDGDYDITHDNDGQGEHGSHVTGIAAANAFIADGEGNFARALNSVYVQGVAPDAQIITMKVFGKGGGAYDSDYMAAIEDAIVLGADSVNLSLGSGNPGMSRNSNATYQAILESLVNSGVVVVMSAGNSGNWVENAYNVGYLYSDDVSMQTDGSPGSFTNSMAVASVDNDGTTGLYVDVAGNIVVYNETDYSNEPFATLAGTQQYVFVDGFGTAEDWAAVGEALQGKIAICSRGTTSFFQKADEAVKAGAIGTFIYNNAAGIFNMDLTDYSYTAPVASLTQADGAVIKANSTPVTDENGNVLYYTGTMTVSSGMGSAQFNSDYYTMSSFSAWGVPGSLELKPEITAPGGNIYSVFGSTPSGGGSDQYEIMSGTSMAAPQVTGMAAVVAQYIRDNDLTTKTGLDARTLAQSLLMSTATPIKDGTNDGNYYPVIQQGAGLANVGAAVSADSYILMNENATNSWADGKVKAELGDDPDRDGVYAFTFTINNLTDAEKTYALSADFFIQAPFLYYANGNNSMDQLSYYMDTLTSIIGADVAWTVNGVALEPSADVDGLDFNGDGYVNSNDGQALLDYVVGTTDSITNADKADIDGDGDVDTYDAYLFLNKLTQGTVVIAADGSATVTVTATLSDSWKATLDYYYPNGTYVEGYVYAESLTDAEGVEGTSHSIPVLAFYGNWSDASMYDVGSYLEYAYGEEYKIPYLGKTTANTYTITYSSDSANQYYFGGNPLVLDDTYKPERNAINSENGDKISKVQFTAIRNAAASRFTVVNETTGETVVESFPGAVSSAYYYVNDGVWRNTGYSLNANFTPKGVAEGDRLTMSLTLAPEYYVDAEGNVNWNALGDGADYAISMTVDNTAPVLEDVSISLTGNTMTVTAKDNQYVSAVVLYNGSGSRVLNYAGAKQDIEPNTSASYTLDLAGINGNKFLLQVADYAMNVTTYKIEMVIGEPEDFSGRIFAFTEGNSYQGEGTRWVEIDKDNLFFYYKSGSKDFGGISDYCSSDLTVVAGEYVDGYVYMAADDGYIYVAPQDDLGVYQKVCYYGDQDIVGMAMNYVDGKMYFMTQAIGDTDAYQMTIHSMDVITGEMTALYDVVVINPWAQSKTRTRLHGLAIDDEGNFYTVNYGTGTQSFLYKWTSDMAVDGKIVDLYPINNTKTGTTGFYGNYASLAWDHDNDVLYMAGVCSESYSLNNALVTFDLTTGKGTKVTDYDGGYGATYSAITGMGVTALYIVPSGNQFVAPTTEPYSVILDRTEVTVLNGASFTLTAEVYPWILEDKSLTWTSSDESIVTVDQNGEVKAVGLGTANITATTNATPSISATCTVTVEKLDNVKLSALIYDVDSATYWSEFETDTLPVWTAVSGEMGSYIGGTLLGETIYVHDGSTMYGIDADTFAVRNLGTIASSWIWSDAAAAPATEDGLFGKVIGLCNNGTFVEMINPEEGSLGYWDLATYFADDPLAVIAYAGSGTYDYSTYYTDCPAVYYYLMTESGQLLQFILFTEDGGETHTILRKTLGETGIDLTGVSSVTAGVYASMVYDEATGYLLLSSYTEGDTTQLYAIDPEVQIPAKIGEFGADVWPVVSMYQYDRATDLTVRINPSTVDIYEKDTYQMTTKVLLADDPTLVWTSSDENVATVDANGVVTGVGAGTATITATTVDTNKDGNTVSASATVNVTALTKVDTTFNAQIVTSEGAKWVTVDTEDLGVAVNGSAATAFSGAGAGGGKIYGTNSDFTNACNIYEINPANGFAETAGSACSTSYAILDMTTAPAMTIDVTDADGNAAQAEAFGMPLYIANAQALMFLLDYQAGSLSGWSSLANYYTDLSAITFIGESTDSSGNPTECFLALGADGTLYSFVITPSYTASTDTVGYKLSRSVYGSIGMEFDNYQSLSMTYDGTGLIIADNSKGAADIYYVDLTAETLSCGKIGRIPGATSISGLYTNADLSGTAAVNKVTDAVNAGEAAEIQASDVVETAVNNTDEIPFYTGTIGTSDLPAPTPVEKSTDAPAAAPAALPALAGQSVEITRFTSGTVAAPMSEAVISDGKDTVTVTVTAKDAEGNDVASTNGLVTVTYDADLLELVGVAVNGDYTSKVETDGSVTFGYVSMNGIAAGETVATLTFAVDEDVNTNVTVQTKQVNNVSGGSESLFVEFAHARTEIRDAKDATCTEDGYTGDTWCLDCDEIIAKGEVIPATGHSYEAVVTDPTCTEEGYTTYTCSVCGDSYVADYVEATGHTYGEWIVTTAPTCEEEGEETHYCEDCDAFETRVVPATGHSYEAVVTAPTCTEDGYTTYTCSVCGHSYVDDIVPATGHSYGEWVVTEEPGCFHDGEKAHTCEICGETETEIIPANSDNCPSKVFTDLDTAKWYHEAVDYVLENGLMNGVDETTFAPNADMTRAQLVTVLYRMAGSPEVTEKAPFTDVKEGSFYEAAVAWAYANGIAKGIDDTTFDPNSAITREQMVTFFARYAEVNGIDTTAEGDLRAFSDGDTVGSYAEDAVVWAVSNGLIEGMEDGTIAPKATATRAQVATVLMRYSEAFN